MLVGDVLAYIDVFSLILLLGLLSRVTAVWLFARQAAEHAVKLASSVPVCVQRFNFRRRRESGARRRKRLTGQTELGDECRAIDGVAWA